MEAACKNGYSDIVKILIYKDPINLNLITRLGTPLMVATSYDSLYVVRLLLSYNDINVNSYYEGNTALLLAAKLDRIEIVDELLKNDNIDVTIMNDHGQSAKNVARSLGNFCIARTLENYENSRYFNTKVRKMKNIISDISNGKYF